MHLNVFYVPTYIHMNNTVEPVYSGHPQDHRKWLLWRGDLLEEVEMHTVDPFGTKSPGCYREVTCYTVTIIDRFHCIQYTFNSATLEAFQHSFS